MKRTIAACCLLFCSIIGFFASQFLYIVSHYVFNDQNSDTLMYIGLVVFSIMFIFSVKLVFVEYFRK